MVRSVFDYMRDKFYRYMGCEPTSMFTIDALVRASLDIDVLHHLHHHWRLCQCCLSPFFVVVFISVVFISVVFISVVLVAVIVVFIILLVHGKVLTIRNSK